MRVGLTGGVASGKSTVARRLGELGAVVVDADLLAREVVARGTPGLARVVEAFGAEVLAVDGELDRAAVGRIVFADEARRRELEAIVHPLVRRRGAELAAQAGPAAVVVYDIPLLVETGQGGEFAAVIVVDAPSKLQIERMVADRGWTREDAESRIAAQATRAERLAVATHVVDNTGTVADLRLRVDQIWAELTDPRDGAATPVDVLAAFDAVLPDFGDAAITGLRVEQAEQDGCALVWLRGSDGTTAGFRCADHVVGTSLIVEVAEFLQEQVLDQSLRTWGQAIPACPGHQHPLTATGSHGPAQWVCPVTRETVALVGHLRPESRPS